MKSIKKIETVIKAKFIFAFSTSFSKFTYSLKASINSSSSRTLRVGLLEGGKYRGTGGYASAICVVLNLFKYESNTYSSIIIYTGE